MIQENRIKNGSLVKLVFFHRVQSDLREGIHSRPQHIYFKFRIYSKVISRKRKLKVFYRLAKKIRKIKLI